MKKLLFTLLILLYPSVTLAGIHDGLIGHWKFDDGSGTNAVDSSGLGFHAKMASSTFPVWSPIGMIGYNKLNFLGGTNGYIEVYPRTDYFSRSEITVSAWVRTETTPNAYNAVVSRVSSGLNSYNQIFVTSAGKLAVYVFGNSAARNYDGTGVHTLTPGVWYHIAYTYSNSGLTGYVNGVIDGTAASGGGVLTGIATTTIGNDINTSSRRFDGDIDDVRIYNRVLSQSEIVELYNYREQPFPRFSITSGILRILQGLLIIK